MHVPRGDRAQLLAEGIADGFLSQSLCSDPAFPST